MNAAPEPGRSVAARGRARRSPPPPTAPARSCTRRSSGSASASKRCWPSRARPIDHDDLARELDDLREDTRLYVKKRLRKSEKRSSARSSEIDERTARLERRIDQVEADRAAAEYRIHTTPSGCSTASCKRSAKSRTFSVATREVRGR